MKKPRKILIGLLLAVFILPILCAPAFAISESEVEAQVAASSKEAVTGNVLIWFLCAVAFLKVSQKIDSFMASLGVNVGHTGGSMLSEAMITLRAATMTAGGAGHMFGGGRRGTSSASGPGGKSGGSGLGGFFKGGLIGMASRKITNDAVKTATSQTAAFHTAQKQAAGAVHTASEKRSASTTRTGSAIHTEGVPQAGGVERSGSGIHTGSFTHTDSSVLRTEAGGVETVNSAPQEGVILTGNDVPPAAAIQTEGADHVTLSSGTDTITHPQQDSTILQSGTESRSDQMPSQEGVIQTGSERVTSSSSEKVHSDTVRQGGDSHGISERHTSSETHTTAGKPGTSSSVTRVSTLGGKIFSYSLQSGGQFANDVIGTVARGDMRSSGTITGDFAAQSLQSYMGQTALGETATEKVRYSEVEIGGGRITGREVTPEHPQGIEFAMYHVDQYSKPEGDFKRVFSADGAQWYKQHAVDTVVKTPFEAPDGEIDYHKKIVKRLPTPPKRKDRM